MSSFTEKKLRATIVLADDSSTVFTATGDNTLVIDQLRMSASVTSNARQATQMSLNIWGMLEADMNALTAAWLDPESIRDNLITLEADSGDGYRLVFTGTILEAQPDFRRVPDVPFTILAMIGYYQSINITPPLSFQGAVDIDVLGRYFADQLGMSYVNVGAKAVLNDPYFPSTVFDQLRSACAAAKVDFYFQGRTLVFAPLLQAQTDQPAVVLTPQTGLVGYPMYTRQGLVVTAIYDAAFQCASMIEIQDSQVKGANGRWFPFSMELSLNAYVPNGVWLAVMQCNKGSI